MSHYRYRRNINCLTSNQLHDLREALQTIYDLPAADPHSFATIAGLHGSPSPSYCIHGSPGFLSWHRAYMMAIENALQCVHSGIMLPFWDWSSGPTTGVPAACTDPTYVNRAGDTVPNPLYSGPIPASVGGGQTMRRADINTTSFADLATTAQSALTNASFGNFQNALNGVHGSVHVRVGGNMSSVATAGFDPIFYLHHCNVDRLWWQWQQSHPGAFPAVEANLQLEPFNKPYSNQWQRGADQELTDNLGYRYSNFCFIIPPIIVWEVVRLEPIPPVLIERLSAMRVVLRSERMQARSMEMRVFVNQPNATVRSKTIDNPRFAGSIGLFGMGETENQPQMISRQQQFDLELDIVDTIRQIGKEDEELTLKLVAVDGNGDRVPAEEIDLTKIELIAE